MEWKGRNLGIALIFSLSSSKETVGSSSCTFWFSFSVDSWDSLDRNPESLDVVAWTSTLVLISEVIHYGVLATKPLEFTFFFEHIPKFEYVHYCKFGCGILKMVGPKMQDFCPRIVTLKGNCFKTILRWIMVHQKKCRTRTLKVNFLCQKWTEFFQKKFV